MMKYSKPPTTFPCPTATPPPVVISKVGYESRRRPSRPRNALLCHRGGHNVDGRCVGLGELRYAALRQHALGREKGEQNRKHEATRGGSTWPSSPTQRRKATSGPKLQLGGKARDKRWCHGPPRLRVTFCRQQIPVQVKMNGPLLHHLLIQFACISHRVWYPLER
jgi:hypothetical protein